MGMRLFGRCYTSPANPRAVAPNPDPSRWDLLAVRQYANAYVLTVRYHGCTNYEGVKIMVFRGRYVPGKRPLDPHFSERGDSPIARFRPDEEGTRLACELAEVL